MLNGCVGEDVEQRPVAIECGSALCAPTSPALPSGALGDAGASPPIALTQKASATSVSLLTQPVRATTEGRNHPENGPAPGADPAAYVANEVARRQYDSRVARWHASPTVLTQKVTSVSQLRRVFVLSRV